MQINKHSQIAHFRAFNGVLFALAILFLSFSGIAEDRSEVNIDPDPLSTTFSPEGSLSKIRVPNGFKLELVAAEPMIEEPVCMAWGPNGELYVAEMRSYMQDIDMSGELEPVSRVVKLVDLDGDGRMDQATTYLNNFRQVTIIPFVDSGRTCQRGCEHRVILRFRHVYPLSFLSMTRGTKTLINFTAFIKASQLRFV